MWADSAIFKKKCIGKSNPGKVYVYWLYSAWIKTALLASGQISFHLQTQAEITGILDRSGLYITSSIKESVAETY